MRADRLITILLLLQNNEKITTRELAKQLEVSERTVHRDMEALSSAGIPVFAERGKSGGWKLIENYQTKLTGLKENEIKSLFLSPSPTLLSDLGLIDDWKESREKLLASIPGSLKNDAIDVWNRIYIDTGTWRNSVEKIDGFPQLQKAIWEERILDMTYKRSDHTMKSRKVNPLGLVAKGRTWYLIASEANTIKSFRASRILSLHVTEDFFVRPDKFNLADFWEQSKQSFVSNLPTFLVSVEVSPEIIDRLMFTGRFVQVIHIDKAKENKWIPVDLQFDSEKEACEYILGFGNKMKIVQPSSLIEKVKKMAEAVVDFYR